MRYLRPVYSVFFVKKKSLAVVNIQKSGSVADIPPFLALRLSVLFLLSFPPFSLFFLFHPVFFLHQSPLFSAFLFFICRRLQLQLKWRRCLVLETFFILHTDHSDTGAPQFSPDVENPCQIFVSFCPFPDFPDQAGCTEKGVSFRASFFFFFFPSMHSFCTVLSGPISLPQRFGGVLAVAHNVWGNCKAGQCPDLQQTEAAIDWGKRTCPSAVQSQSFEVVHSGRSFSYFSLLRRK